MSDERPSTNDLADLAEAAGLRRVHILAWRELADVEAGGSEIYVARVAERWAAAGLDVTVRTSFAQGQSVEATRDGYRIVRRGGRHSVFPTAVTAELLHSYGPRDGVFEVWNGVPFLSPVWANCANATLVHHIHKDMWDMILSPRLAAVGRLLEGRLAPPLYRRTPFVTPSPSSRDEIVDLFGVSTELITVAPPGLDEQYQPGGEKSPRPLVVACGRLMPPKRFDELIRVADEVRRRHPDLELVIAGEGYERPRLEKVVRMLDAEDWVRLAGHVSEDEKVSLYQQAWLVASTSIAEGWGMSLTEAAACGTPAVATRITGHSDSVAHDESGLLASGSREMVDHIDALLSDPDLRHRLGEGARKRSSEFTWDVTAYRSLAALASDAIRRQRQGRGRSRR